MKTIILLVFISVLIVSIKAQTPCNEGSARDSIIINPMKATFSTNGTLLMHNSTFFTSSLWIGGLDRAQGNLHVAANTYNQVGYDFTPGILNTSGFADSSVCNSFDKIFTITKNEIENHIADFSDNGIIDAISDNVKYWPGKNNINLPESMNVGELAPFFDMNNDGNYSPFMGDYPLTNYNFQNKIADVAKFWIVNDNGNIHSESGARSLGIQMNCIAYAFTENNLQHSILIDTRIENKSQNIYDSTYIGVFTDVDLGAYNDDYIGVDTINRIAYFYNGDNFDEYYSSNNIPIAGFKILYQPTKADGSLYKNKFMYFNNINNNQQGNPKYSQQFYDYLSGTWGDGVPREFGGDGYMEGTYPVNYLYPSNPSESASPITWSECTENSIPGDRRGVYSFGDFSFNPNEAITLTIAYAISHPVLHPCPNANAIVETMDSIETFLRFGSANNVFSISEKNDVTLSPNPTKDFIKINTENTFEAYRILNIQGQTLQQGIFTNVIQTSRLTNGVYWIELKNGDKNVIKKIIIE